MVDAADRGVRPFFLICAFFLVSRLLLLNYNEAEFTDGYAFLDWSWSPQIKLTDDLPSERLPAYPVLIQLFALFLDPIFSGRLISAFAGFLCLFPLYALASELYGARAALLASVLFTVSAQIVFLTTRVFSEPLFLAFSLAAILHALKLFRDNNDSSLPWLVLFSGLSVWTRPEGFAFAPLIILGFVLLVRRRRRRSLFRSLVPLCLWLAFFAWLF